MLLVSGVLMLIAWYNIYIDNFNWYLAIFQLASVFLLAQITICRDDNGVVLVK